MTVAGAAKASKYPPAAELTSTKNAAHGAAFLCVEAMAAA